MHIKACPYFQAKDLSFFLKLVHFHFNGNPSFSYSFAVDYSLNFINLSNNACSYGPPWLLSRKDSFSSHKNFLTFTAMSRSTPILVGTSRAASSLARSLIIELPHHDKRKQYSWLFRLLWHGLGITHYKLVCKMGKQLWILFSLVKLCQIFAVQACNCNWGFYAGMPWISLPIAFVMISFVLLQDIPLLLCQL